ncbi:FRG domain-containing protein [Sphingobium yanoikuyae]|uniref:FRG domain-containing protein n=1 Tax=Sphingobium yanoikuyae TaxID=13690 RepID=A0A2D1R141_SPHYA|nr:FRG domain-containing protein [Sphingobium yanoikuyae]ATP18556.1 hypothetical protein BV87_09240 [Sphingobium yanoikuyae]
MSVGLKIIASYLEVLADKLTTPAIYRGHADASWKPVPTAFREDGFGITNLLELARWKEIAGRFRDRSLTDIEWLVLAQHYGVHTPLLDWTSNPLVALFFACQSEKGHQGLWGSSGAVLQITTTDIERIPPNRNPFDDWVGRPFLVNAESMNARTLAQDSMMTLHCATNSKMNDGYDPNIFYVEAHSKPAVLSALRMFGVSSERIYADINTAARDFQERLAHDANVRQKLGSR